jgi:multiple sugar transport system permease protein
MTITNARTAAPSSGDRAGKRRRYRGIDQLGGLDRLVIILMVVVPTLLLIWLVWFPAVGSVILSFTNWDGIGPLSSIKFIGLKNYVDVVTIYPPFWPAVQHNLIWLAVYFLVATPLGIFFAVLLDREIRGTRIYQTAIYLPVVLSLALVGFIWQLIYSKDQGLINGLTGSTIDWYGDPRFNLWAALVAATWKQTGYVMLLYLAGLKGVDPSLREAAKVDGANERQTFFRVVFPVMAPINIIVLVITVIEGLRAFDIVYVVNRGRNGLELLSVLVFDNIVGEASRIGFGSALAVILFVICVGFIITYMSRILREEER